MPSTLTSLSRSTAKSNPALDDHRIVGRVAVEARAPVVAHHLPDRDERAAAGRTRVERRLLERRLAARDVPAAHHVLPGEVLGVDVDRVAERPLFRLIAHRRALLLRVPSPGCSGL